MERNGMERNGMERVKIKIHHQSSREVDVIPRNPTGKVLKRVLRDQFDSIRVD